MPSTYFLQLPKFDASADTDPNIPSKGYEAMSQAWPLIHALLGGTRRMIAESYVWLPPEPAEDPGTYAIRRDRSVLLGATEDTIDKLSAKPFSRAVTVDQLPDQLEYLLQDMDGEGRSLTSVGQEALKSLMTYGIAHLMVDFTHVDRNTQAAAGAADPASKAQEKKTGARVVVRQVDVPRMIAWRPIKLPEGGVVPDSCRIWYTRTEAGSGFQEVDVEYVKEWTRHNWREWRRNPKSQKWSISSEPKAHSFAHEGTKRIPLVTIYLTREGFMVARPPLERLAWLELAHFRSDSDQRNVLRMARFATMFASGLTEEETEKGFTLGPTNLITSTSSDARLEYVEHTGAAINSGFKDLENLESRMDRAGAQPTAVGSGTTTATGSNLDESRNMSALQVAARAIETGLRLVLEYAGAWHKTPVPKETSVDVFSDFKVTLYDDSDGELMLKASDSGRMSTRRFLMELKRRGKLPESFDVDEELVRIEAEARGMLTGDIDELRKLIEGKRILDSTKTDDDEDDTVDELEVEEEVEEVAEV